MTHASIACCLWLVEMAQILVTGDDPPQKCRVLLVAVLAPYAAPFAILWASSKPTALILSDTPTCRGQFPTLVQRWPPPSLPKFTLWRPDHFSLYRSNCHEFDRDFRVSLSWFWVISKILPAFTKTDTLLSLWLSGHTVSPVYGHHPAINTGCFNAFRSQKSDNTSLLFNHWMLQC